MGSRALQRAAHTCGIAVHTALRVSPRRLGAQGLGAQGLGATLAALGLKIEVDGMGLHTVLPR